MSAFLDRTYDVMVVSSNDKFNISIKKILKSGGFHTVRICTNASLAKRELAQRNYDIVVVNTPLTDEFGIDLSLDISTEHGLGTLILSGADMSDDVADRVTDYGVISLAKPLNGRSVIRGIRLLCAWQDRIKNTEKKAISIEEKITEIRIVNRAKWYLIDKEHMSEAQANDYITKHAMNQSLTKKAVAMQICDRYGD